MELLEEQLRSKDTADTYPSSQGHGHLCSSKSRGSTSQADSVWNLEEFELRAAQDSSCGNGLLLAASFRKPGFSCRHSSSVVRCVSCNSLKRCMQDRFQAERVQWHRDAAAVRGRSRAEGLVCL